MKLRPLSGVPAGTELLTSGIEGFLFAVAAVGDAGDAGAALRRCEVELKARHDVVRRGVEEGARVAARMQVRQIILCGSRRCDA